MIHVGRRIAVGGLIIGLLFVWGGGTAAATDGPRTLAVSAQAEVRAAPDLARFQVAVETRAASAEAARTENARRMADVQEALRAAGVEDKDVQTGGFNVREEWRHNPSDGTREFVGFVVHNSLRVTTTDLDGLGELLDGAVEAGATQIHGLSFGLRDPDELVDAALIAAVERARRKAETMARAAGLFLKGVLRVSEHVTTPFGGPVAEMEFARMSVADAAPAPVTSVAPGEISVTATVNITYEI